MVTVTTPHDSRATLDPHVFTLKPKMNEKSNQIAQNLLSGFYERQFQHARRLQEIQKDAGIDHRQWYCPIRSTQLPKPLPNINTNNQSTGVAETLLTAETETKEKPILTRKEAHHSNAHLSRLIRAYRTPLTLKTTHSTSPPSVATAPPTSSLVSVPLKTFHRMPPSNRSKSPPKVARQADPSPKRSMTNDTINTERLKLARDEAERAMKEHKIFTIIGPYPAIREALRRRGWVEKFYRGNSLPSVHGNKKSDKKNKSDDDDEDDNDDDNNDDDDLEEHPSYEDEDKIPPWEENDGYYGLLSRLVRTAAPNFIWSVRASHDTSTLNKDQMVNHYSRNGCFTTKVGLCNSLRNLQWFHSGCADQFFPRCYKLTHEDDKVAFIDDYRLTACISFLKLIHNRCKGIMEPDMNSILAMSSDNPTDPNNPPATNDEESQLTRSLTMLPGQLGSKPLNGKSSSTKKVPLAFIEFALNNVNDYVLARDHEDIDLSLSVSASSSDEQWTQFIDQFYAASHSNVEIEGMEVYINKIDECLKHVEQHWPQYHIDGTRNIWILKPGAKSRGRGIVVYDRLEDILKLCSSTLSKDGKFVVQKYIERPLLIHNTKFDIRQWFLVTDWNPLTIWMFKDCYLRFCTEHFSLETRQQNVHLCNYSIQKHYKNNSKRHIDLPVENMWNNTEFIEKYLRPNHLADRWDKCIYPAMKEAIICSMLVAQDTIDTRKSSFELFGADFMLGEDLKPWLIEINCSPTMARSTAVTTEMCDGVLEDTCKVMIDRKYNRTADTGRFELIHKGTIVPVPIYVGIDLRVEGKVCKTGRPLNTVPMPIVGTQTNNNVNTTNPIIAPASAPPQTNLSSTPSLSSTPPAETRPSLPHPTSAVSAHHQSFSTKNSTNPVTLKLRREMTQPALSRVELVSSADLPLEKAIANDCMPFPTQFRSNISVNTISKSNPNLQLDIRQKQMKINPSRLSVDYLPVRQISRSKVNDHIHSPKGNSNKSQEVSKINASDFLFAGKDVRQPHQFTLFRPYQRTWTAYQTGIAPNPKSFKHRKTTTAPSVQPTLSTLSIGSTFVNLSPLDTSNEHTKSSATIRTIG